MWWRDVVDSSLEVTNHYMGFQSLARLHRSGTRQYLYVETVSVIEGGVLVLPWTAVVWALPLLFVVPRKEGLCCWHCLTACQGE